ncbi:NAD(P)H-binding protein [Streptomyces sp. NPDC085929]|uniref:NAD(P)H-binding protein n=1 Tax=Streptomyces sp. NPDC085929 TaxID=3365739 RepID=UPI0037CDE889
MILVTGATGGLGKLVVERLAGRDDVVAGTRSPQQAPAGVPVRHIDFDDPASMADGFAGVDTLLLISAGYGEDDVVIARHGAAIEAAEKNGIEHIVYTSLSAAGDHLAYALPHRWTERRLMGGSARWTILRNGLYAELLALFAVPDPEGRLTAPLGGGRLAAVAREDLADAAVRVVTSASSHAARTYELVGEEAIGGEDLARLLTEAAGTPVPFEPGTLAGAREAITASGAAAFQVPMLLSTLSAIAGGFMGATGSDLAGLLGRPPRSALDVITAAVHARP